MKTIAIVGTVGVPASYGGFETLVENLVRHHQANGLPGRIVVYCSGKSYTVRRETYMGAELRYIGLKANGVSSIFYDMASLIAALYRGSDVILLLGVSGAIALPLVRILSRARVVTNIDGIEWKRKKWRGLARWFLRISERLAVKFSHEIVADNTGIAKHAADSYGRICHVIAYGGDHAIQAEPQPYESRKLPARYALAVCRIEPENNVEMILQTFLRRPGNPLVFIGNWDNSHFGKTLREQYGSAPHLYLLDPIYDLSVLRSIREHSELYVHGHSAGGTNPSLVEMMHFGKPILAYDCIFNRATTDSVALYFSDIDGLCRAIDSLTPDAANLFGTEMKRIAMQRYAWGVIGEQYFRLLL